MSSESHQNLINVSSAKFLKTLVLRHIEARFMFASVAMTDPRGSTKGAWLEKIPAADSEVLAQHGS